MSGLLHLFLEHDSAAGVVQLVVFTLIMGGGAAYMAGKALAGGWKSLGLLVIYMLVFTAGLRFLDYALFGSNLLSLKYFLTHGLIVMAAALLGFRLKRVSQMVSQYPWLYERAGLFAWRPKS